MPTAVILPVKSLGRAKQRLGEAFAPPVRAALAAAMLEDVLDVLGRVAPPLGPLVLVTREPRLRDEGVVKVVDDREAGQSAAALLGIARARELGCDRALLVPGDCPLIDAGDLRGLVARAEQLDVAIVPDRHGTGTNALVLATDCGFEPQFGPASCARHVAQAAAKGLRHEVIGVPSLELDVDTGDDAAALVTALARFPARAPRTRAALTRAAA